MMGVYNYLISLFGSLQKMFLKNTAKVSQEIDTPKENLVFF